MASEWYYSQGTERKGPIPTNELARLAKNGVLNRSTLVFKKGMKEWTPAANVAGLFTEEEPPPLPLITDDDPVPMSAEQAAKELAALHQASARPEPSSHESAPDRQQFAERREKKSSVRKDTPKQEIPGGVMTMIGFIVVFNVAAFIALRLLVPAITDGSGDRLSPWGTVVPRSSIWPEIATLLVGHLVGFVAWTVFVHNKQNFRPHGQWAKGRLALTAVIFCIAIAGFKLGQMYTTQPQHPVSIAPTVAAMDHRDDSAASPSLGVAVSPTKNQLSESGQAIRTPSARPSPDAIRPSPVSGVPAKDVNVTRKDSNPATITFQYSLDGTSEETRRILPTSDDLKRLENDRKNGDGASAAATAFYQKLQLDGRELWTIQDYRARLAACRQINKVTGYCTFFRTPGTRVICGVDFEKEMAPVFVTSSKNPEQFLERLRAVNAANVRPLLHEFLKKNYSDLSTKLAFCDWLKGNGIADPALDDYRDSLLDEGAKAGATVSAKVLSANEARSLIDIAPAQLVPPKTPVEPAATTVEAKKSSTGSHAPVPTTDLLKAAEASIRDIFKEEFKKTDTQDQLALASKLFDLATGTKDDQASRYQLFDCAANLYAKNGALSEALRVITAMDAEYQIDARTLNARALADIGKVAKTKEQFTELAHAYVQQGDKDLTVSNNAGATNSYKTAQSHARAAQDVPLYTAIGKKIQDLDGRKSVSERLNQYRDKLAENPNDLEANDVLGKYDCLERREWDQGLPMLSKGSDETLKKLAALELARPVDPNAQAVLADGWWAAADKATGSAQAAMRERSCLWYAKAIPSLNGLARAKAEQRVVAAPPSITSGPFAGRSGVLRPALLAVGGGTAATESAVNEALEWLDKHQEADGHWDSVKYGSETGKVDTALTSLALLAFLGAGHSEKVGQHKDNVLRAVAWLLSKQQANGLVFDQTDTAGVNFGYSAAMATMALSEASGMANIETTKEAAQKSVNYCVAVHQNGEGSEKEVGTIPRRPNLETFPILDGLSWR